MHVLFLGNGFDLYHGLKTSYKDFLRIIKNLNEFKEEIRIYKGERRTEKELLFKDLFEGLLSINTDNSDRIYDLLYGNIWTKYFAKCNADIQGWIDFENAINPVLDLFRNVFVDGVGVTSSDRFFRVPTYKAKSYKEVGLANILNMFFINSNETIYEVKSMYYDKTYGLLKSKIISDLESDLERFTLAFNLYLIEFVEARHINQYKWINNISPDRIISFNYTKKEREYFSNLPENVCSHVHGMTDYNNIVFGTDLIEDTDEDFIRFSKRYQRLMKVGDFSYLSFVTESFGFNELFDNGSNKGLEVSFIGCSLDKNDSKIFMQYIEEAEVINIYCYGFDDYRKAIGNLIGIFDSDFIGQLQRKRKLLFWDIKDLAYDAFPKKVEPKAYFVKKMANDRNYQKEINT